MADGRTGDQPDAGEPERQRAVEAAASAALERITPGTRELRAFAAASGRLLLAALASWIDGDVRRAETALNEDLRGTEEDDEVDAAVAARLAGPGDPATLVDVMTEVLDAASATEGIDAVLWRRVHELTGDWLRVA